MKRLYALGLCTLVFTCEPALALNPVSGPYAGLILGVNYTPNTTFNFTTPMGKLITGGEATLKYSIMGNIGGQLGYRCDNFRIEAEGLYNNSPYSNLSFPYVTISGSGSDSSNLLSFTGATNIYSAMFNAYYDFFTPNTDVDFVPYAGFGIGYAYAQNSIEFFENGTAITASNTNVSSNNIAGQAIAGLSYFLDDYTAFSLDFRYFGAFTTRNNTLPYATINYRPQYVALNLLFNGTFDLG